MPPNVRLIKANNKLGDNENINMPIKNPTVPVTNIGTKYFCGEIFPIIRAPIRAPKPSEEASIPILISDKINFSLPKIGINETNGNTKNIKNKCYY